MSPRSARLGPGRALRKSSAASRREKGRPPSGEFFSSGASSATNGSHRVSSCTCVPGRPASGPRRGRRGCPSSTLSPADRLAPRQPPCEPEPAHEKLELSANLFVLQFPEIVLLLLPIRGQPLHGLDPGLVQLDQVDESGGLLPFHLAPPFCFAFALAATAIAAVVTSTLWRTASSSRRAEIAVADGDV